MWPGVLLLLKLASIHWLNKNNFEFGRHVESSGTSQTRPSKSQVSNYCMKHLFAGAWDQKRQNLHSSASTDRALHPPVKGDINSKLKVKNRNFISSRHIWLNNLSFEICNGLSQYLVQHHWASVHKYCQLLGWVLPHQTKQYHLQESPDISG